MKSSKSNARALNACFAQLENMTHQKSLESHAETTKAMFTHLGRDMLVQRFPKPRSKLDFVNRPLDCKKKKTTTTRLSL